ncbi:HAMP domain-containing protein, partial [bacterium]|nr:HAMP domain-containing protein [bacterium]
MIFISQLNGKQKFFEVAENFAFEIQEARRLEKNFFLYRAENDFYDALNHINAASTLFQDSTIEMHSILKQKEFENLTTNLIQYESILNQIISQLEVNDTSRSMKDINKESQLHLYGHKILIYASDLVNQERLKVHAAAHTFLLSSIFLLVINFIAIIWVATELSRQILQPLSRAVGYAERIGTGDFTPITPKCKYRDEFSQLAIAINHMI